jgi:hypothetical protein
MGAHAQRRRRGRGGGASVTFGTPVLSNDGGGNLTWTVAGPQPTKFLLFFDDGLGGGFVLFTTGNWTDQPFDSSADNGDWKIRGADGAFSPVTPFSNVIST